MRNIDVIDMRKTHRIVGTLVGQLPVESLAPKALSNQGLPLFLSPQEAYFLWSRNACRIVRYKANTATFTETPQKLALPKRVEISTEHSPNELAEYEDFDCEALWKDYFADEAHILKQKVFTSLWSRGFYVQVSTHLFTDFVIYEADPLLIHAAFVVVCLFWNQKFKLLDLMAYGRLASTVKKSILLASERSIKVQDSSITLEGPEDLSKGLEDLHLHPTSTHSPPNTEKPIHFGMIPDGKEIALVEFRWSGVS